MSDNAFRVVGVDLAAQPKKTAYCVIRVGGGAVQVQRPKLGKEFTADCRLLELFQGEDPACSRSREGKEGDNAPVVRIGIDAPFGWPVGFIRALSEHSDKPWPDDKEFIFTSKRVPGEKDSAENFPYLKYRATDFHIWDHIRQSPRKRLKPISVAVNSLGSVAIRCAHLLSKASKRLDVDLSGQTGNFVEVYPAAAFARWCIPIADITVENGKQVARTYKHTTHQKSKERRKLMFDAMVAPLGLSDGSMIREEFEKNDHYVDALASALVALMVHLDPKRTGSLIEEIADPKNAETEGWIALPTAKSLENLPAELGNLR